MRPPRTLLEELTAPPSWIWEGEWEGAMERDTAEAVMYQNGPVPADNITVWP